MSEGDVAPPGGQDSTGIHRLSLSELAAQGPIVREDLSTDDTYSGSAEAHDVDAADRDRANNEGVGKSDYWVPITPMSGGYLMPAVNTDIPPDADPTQSS